ncbi:LysE family translocator [Balneolaceae bacterium ANBcel3]|nr:LysE family translocator [Balneolaceae bacterium ANBcel3]
MLGIENYFGFLIAGIVLNITPGSDTIYVLTRSITQGKKAGYYSVYGITTGGLIHTLLASLGLSVILSKSATAFMVVQYSGVAYLVYLGIRMLTDKSSVFENTQSQIEKMDLNKIYKQGVFTNLLNPKVALFFLAFLPQFINPEYVQGATPFILLGLTFMTTGAIWCLFLAHSSSMLTEALRNNEKFGKVMQRLSGLIFIGLGIKLLIEWY